MISKKSLKIILTSNRPSFLDAWVSRHEKLFLELMLEVDLTIIITLDGIYSNPNLKHIPIIILEMPASSGRLRNLAALNHHESDFVMFAADDDTITAIDCGELHFIDHEVIGILPHTYFLNNNGVLHDANSNNFSASDTDTEMRLIKYFSPPSPGDNSIYYGLFSHSSLIEIYTTHCFDLPHELIADDWIVMTRLLLKGSLRRSNNFILLRQMTPWSSTMEARNPKEIYDRCYKFFDSFPLLPATVVVRSLLTKNKMHRPIQSIFLWNRLKHSQYMSYHRSNSAQFDIDDLSLLENSVSYIEGHMGKISIFPLTGEYLEVKYNHL